MSRPSCPHCVRPISTCLCTFVQCTANRTDVVILQHPLEQHHAKGSATLLQLSLNHCRTLIGETFDLHHLLNNPTDQRQNILLYPITNDDHFANVVTPAQLDPVQTRLILLDGTWRKSRKILHLNPQLAALPRLHLDNLPAGRYHIRKAQQADQLSTLEACCVALARIEQTEEHYQPLLNAFDQFNNSLAKFLPQR